jgi:hypothetical protein
VEREVRILTVTLTCALSACAAKPTTPPPRAVAVAVARAEMDPWVELQRLPYVEHDAFIARLAQDDPERASALVARVVTEGVPPCSTLEVADCEAAYDEAWREDLRDQARLADACVATHFVAEHADRLVDADRAAVAEDLVALLGDDPGSHELLWDTVAELVPVAAAPAAWASLLLHPEFDAEATARLRDRVWQHITSAPTEARRQACEHAARQRDDAEAAMRGAACLAELGDASALPVHEPALAPEEIAFALHMLAFDDTPTAADRLRAFAGPAGVWIVSGSLDEDGDVADSTRELSRTWSRDDLPWSDAHLPGYRVRGLECEVGPPATCRIRRGLFLGPAGEQIEEIAAITLAEHPSGGWAVVEVHTLQGGPSCEDR